MSDDQPKTLSPGKGKKEGHRGRTQTKQAKAHKLDSVPDKPDTITISTDESELSSDEAKPDKRRRRDESLQARRYREHATRARPPPNKMPTRRGRRNAINAEVMRLARQLKEADRHDRANENISQWCTQRSIASTAVTEFIGKYYLDMRFIRPQMRLRFAKACVLCLRPYPGNDRPTFDVSDAMWRMLRALELDLEISKECGVDDLFQYWHDKKIYCRHVRKIAMQVEKRLMDMRCLSALEG